MKKKYSIGFPLRPDWDDSAENLPRALHLGRALAQAIRSWCSFIFGCEQNLVYRKTDMERKIEIFNFASRTRMLLVRLLALVRWASSASKVNSFYISSSLHCIACVCHQAHGLIKGGQVCQHRDVPWEAIWALPRHGEPAGRNGERNLGDSPTSSSSCCQGWIKSPRPVFNSSSRGLI